MKSVEKSIVVDAPVEMVYQFWANFENYPKFMKSMHEVRRIDEKQYYFRSERGGKEYEIIAEMALQIPERRVAWRTTSGEESSGAVSFEPETGESTKIHFRMIYDSKAGWPDPEALSDRLQSNLENFKKIIETGIC